MALSLNFPTGYCNIVTCSCFCLGRRDGPLVPWLGTLWNSWWMSKVPIVCCIGVSKLDINFNIISNNALAVGCRLGNWTQCIGVYICFTILRAICLIGVCSLIFSYILFIGRKGKRTYTFIFNFLLHYSFSTFCYVKKKSKLLKLPAALLLERKGWFS